MPLLTVRRDQGWADKLRKYRIILDGVEIGQLAEGAVLSQEITDESHILEARIDWWGSQTLCFEPQASSKVVLVKSALRGWGLLGLIYVIFNRRRYLALELEQ